MPTTPFPEYHLADVATAPAAFPDRHFDAVLTDPPFGIRVTPKETNRPTWDGEDSLPFSADFWATVRRVTKPGGNLAVFGHPRTYRRLATAIETAGWQIIDVATWIHGQGFALSNRDLDVELEALGADPALVESYRSWGTQLRPAQELICIARNLEPGKSLPQTITESGTGGLNLDALRTPTTDDRKGSTDGLIDS